MSHPTFGTRDDIRDAARAAAHHNAQARAAEANERSTRERRRAEMRAAEDGSPPLVLGRAWVRQAAGLCEFALVDRQPSPIRVTLARGEAVDPVQLVGVMRTIGATLLEHQGYSEPGGSLWKRGVIDPFGGGGAAIPENVPAIGEPLYASGLALDVTHEPSDEDRASALAAAHEAVAMLATTKSRARDLAAALRLALAAGPHAVEAIALALDEHGRPAGEPTPPTPPTTPTTNEPPRAA